MVLVIDTATEKAFIGLWDKVWVTKDSFVGGRNLNKIIIQKLKYVFDKLQDNTDDKPISGVIVSAGPGSFTGLRIGISVANTIAYTYDIPITGVTDETDVEKLLQKGKSVLESRGAPFEGVVVPHYGAEPHITQPKQKG